MFEKILFAIYLLGMITIIFKASFFNLKDISRFNLSLIFITKIIVGFILLYYYQTFENHKLTSDFQVFYFQAEKLFNQFNNSPSELIKIIINAKSDSILINKQLSNLHYWNRDFDYGIINDNQTMIRINLLFLFISNNYYPIHLLFFSFIGFIGITCLIKTLLLYRQRINRLFINIIYLTPTSLIWTSGMLKETILIGILGIIIYLSNSILLANSKRKWLIYLLLIISCYLSIYIKPIFILLTIPSFIFLLISTYQTKITPVKLSVVVNISLASLLILVIGFTHTNDKTIEKDNVKYGNNFDLMRIIAYKQDDFFYEAKHKKATSITELNKLDGSIKSLIFTLPDAFQNTFLKPSIFDMQNKKYWPFIIENSFLLVFIISLIKKRDELQWNNPITLFFISLTFTIGLFLGLLNPILGTLLRFKSIVYLFLFSGLISTLPNKKV